jgi:hypothetical protein
MTFIGPPHFGQSQSSLESLLPEDQAMIRDGYAMGVATLNTGAHSRGDCEPGLDAIAQFFVTLGLHPGRHHALMAGQVVNTRDPLLQ